MKKKPASTYPLTWPPGWPRTESGRRQRANFKTTLARSLEFMREEVRRLGGKNLVISSNCTLGDANPDDPGVCAYFEYQDIRAAIPCDRWHRVEDNLHAIAKTIEAMRGIDRWGAKHMLKAAFTGFAALPAPGKGSGKGWREVLGFPADRTPPHSEILSNYRHLRAKHHPDKPGGSAEMFGAVQNAWELAQQEVRA